MPLCDASVFLENTLRAAVSQKKLRDSGIRSIQQYTFHYSPGVNRVSGKYPLMKNL